MLNTVAKYYPQVDRPVKTGRSMAQRSDNSRPKSRTSEKSVGAKSAKSGKSAKSEVSDSPRTILNPGVVQNFIYTYISEKLKTEKLSMRVDCRYEKLLASLANPLALNEMRTMKEEKYYDLRSMITKFLGSPALRLIKDNAEALELDPDVFDLVYEGFWDLYTFHP